MGAGAGMALSTGDPTMYRTSHFQRVYEEGSLLSITYHGEIRVRVAVQAILIRHLSIENPAHLMRLMAIDTHRNFMRFLFPQLTVNHLAMNLLDSPMTLLTGVGHVVTVNSGAGIGVGQNMMRGMTVAADRRHRQALLEEPHAVDGKRIM
jgi:hypothetical protein